MRQERRVEPRDPRLVPDWYANRDLEDTWNLLSLPAIAPRHDADISAALKM